MAKTISQRIALEGGDDIKKRLADLGEAGERAFARIKTAAERAGGIDKLPVDKIKQQLAEVGLTGEQAFQRVTAAVQKALQTDARNAFAGLQEGLANVSSAAQRVGVAGAEAGGKLAGAFGQAAPAIEQTGSSLTSLVTKLGLVIAGIAAAASALSTALAKGAADSATKLTEAAAAANMSVTSYLRYKGIVDQTGASQGDFDKAIEKTNKTLTRFATGGLQQVSGSITAQVQKFGDHTVQILRGNTAIEAGKKKSDAFADALRGIGIQMQHLVGASPEQLFERIAASLARFNGEQRKVELAKLGPEFAKLGPFFDGLIEKQQATAKSTRDMAGDIAANAPKLKEAFAGIKEGIDLTDTGNKKALDSAQKLFDGFLKGTTSVEKLGAGLTALYQEMGDDKESKSKIKTFVNDLDQLKSKVPETVRANQDVTKSFWDQFEAVAAAGKATREFGGPGLQQAIRTMDAADLTTAWSDLQAAIKATRDQIGELFVGSKTRQAVWLTKLVDASRALVLEWVRAKQAFVDAFVAEQGGELSLLSKGLEEAGKWAREFGTVLQNVVGPVVQAIASGFSFLAEKINELFGSEISGRAVAIVAVLGLIASALGLLKAGILPIAAAIGVATGAFARFGAAGEAAAVTTGTATATVVRGGAAMTETIGVARAGFVKFGQQGKAAVASVAKEVPPLARAFQELGKGNFAKAWDSLKAAAFKAWDDIKKKLAETPFAPLLTAIAAIALALSGLTFLFNTVFGTNISTETFALVLLLGKLLGVFALLGTAAKVLAFALTPIRAAVLTVAAAAIVLSRLFPDVGKSLDNLGESFRLFFSGDFSGALQKLQDAFKGFWDNLKKEGTGTFLLLGAAAVIAATAINTLIVRTAALRALFLSTFAPLIAVATALGLISDVNRGAGPFGDIDKKTKALIDQFNAGKISAEQFAEGQKQIAAETVALAEKMGAAATSSGTATSSISDQMKKASEEIKKHLGGIPGASQDASGQVVTQWAGVAGKISGQFKQISPGAFQNVGKAVKDAKAQVDEIIPPITQAKEALATLSPTPVQRIDAAFDALKDDAAETGAALVKVVPPEQVFNPWITALRVVRQLILDINKLPNPLSNPISSAGAAEAGAGAAQAGVGAGPAGGQFDTMKAAALAAFTEIATAASAMAAQITLTLESFGSVLTVPFQTALITIQETLASIVEAVRLAAASAADAIVTEMNRAVEAARAALAAMQAAARGAGGGGGGGGGFASGGRVRGPGTGTSDSVMARLSRGEYVQPAHVVRQPGVLAFLEMLRRAGGDLRQVLKRFSVPLRDGGLALPRFSLGGIPSFAGGGAVGAAAAVVDYSDILEKIRSAIISTSEAIGKVLAIISQDVVSIKEILGSMKWQVSQKFNESEGRVPPGGINESEGRFAGGGQLRGRPGRDTNLAWLTDKEYVMRVPAVEKYGVGFMHAINSLRLPKDFLERLRGFNLGGFVEGLTRSLAIPIPRFNDGGLAEAIPVMASGAGRRGLTLVLDGRKFGGLTGPNDVMDALERHAALSQISSAGKAPSWYK